MSLLHASLGIDMQQASPAAVLVAFWPENLWWGQAPGGGRARTELGAARVDAGRFFARSLRARGAHSGGKPPRGGPHPGRLLRPPPVPAAEVRASRVVGPGRLLNVPAGPVRGGSVGRAALPAGELAGGCACGRAAPGGSGGGGLLLGHPGVWRARGPRGRGVKGAFSRCSTGGGRGAAAARQPAASRGRPAASGPGPPSHRAKWLQRSGLAPVALRVLGRHARRRPPRCRMARAEAVS